MAGIQAASTSSLFTDGNHIISVTEIEGGDKQIVCRDAGDCHVISSRSLQHFLRLDGPKDDGTE